MRRITHLVVHCSATPPSRDIGAREIRHWHLRAGWRDIGYHYVIRRSGALERGRPEVQVGAHVAGHNATSIGICLVGGVAEGSGQPEDNITAEQRDALRALLIELKGRYPLAEVCGHRDLSPDRNRNGTVEPSEWVKACPSFDMRALWREWNT